jgi:hypothetical protein
MEKNVDRLIKEVIDLHCNQKAEEKWRRNEEKR